MEVLGKLRNLDAYPKINEDFYNRTLSDGIITIASTIVIFFLFISEITVLRGISSGGPSPSISRGTKGNGSRDCSQEQCSLMQPLLGFYDGRR
ncbi:endoplasmic reticulum-Golgi intermediate compartment protein 3-like [Iris pallida]|uniref:Endoplasmic reticulum-Golgi intermediate compartment protein 3-like n=1 Tax=Iris pallida TaxID=29817 RepID=A0AAX6G231_IRIPA|nr:endoplasmic reticulum-Golgi intermediate compartment protein 3-like [Iris pallida]